MNSDLTQTPLQQVSGTPAFVPASGWRRMAAALVDLLVLWVVGEILALLFLEEFIAMGRSGRLIGGLFFVAYLGGQNSKLREGRTLGKRLFHLRTVSVAGGFLSLERSIARAFVLVLPPLCHGVFLYPDSAALALVSNALLFALPWGWGLALLLSYLKSGQSGQALHDRLLGSAVVFERIEPERAYPRLVFHPFHFGFALSTWLALMAAMGAGATCLWGACGHWPQVVQAQRAAANIEDARTADVYRGAFFLRTRSGEIERTQFAQVSVSFRAPVDDPSTRAREIANLVLPALGTDLDAIRITVAWGFDLLVARRIWAQSFVRRPVDWQDDAHLARPYSAAPAVAPTGSGPPPHSAAVNAPAHVPPVPRPVRSLRFSDSGPGSWHCDGTHSPRKRKAPSLRP